MLALRMTAWQQPAEVVEVPEPDPGPGQVLVRVGGAGACHSDLHLTDDVPAELAPFELPCTLGHETAGWIEAVGPGTTAPEIGTPVAVYGHWGCGTCGRCRVGWENHCEVAPHGAARFGGVGLDGGMAELLLVPDPRLLVPLGELDPAMAAPLTDAALTPYHAMQRGLPHLTGDSTAVVIGIGGLGHIAVQLLRELSHCRVIAVDRRESALATALGVGAGEAILGDGDALREVRRATGRRGADLVLDFVGTDDTMALALGVAGDLATVAIVGIAGGTLPYCVQRIRSGVTLSNPYWGTIPELHEVIALAQAGRIHVEIERFALREAPLAYEHLRAGAIQGRAVVVP